jgi:MFS family permease
MDSLLRRNTDFGWLWTGQLVSQLGTKIYLIALAWYFVHTRHDPRALVGMLLAGSLPVMALGPLAGPLIDRFDRRLILIWADLASFTFCAGIAACIRLQLDQGWIFLFVFLLGLSEVFFNPSARALVPAMVGPEHIQAATSRLSMVYNLAGLVGAAGGGALVGFFGTFNAVGINAASFLFSAFASWKLRTLPCRLSTHGNLWLEMKGGFRYVRRHRMVFRMLVLASCLNLFFVAIVVYLPVLVSNVLKLGPSHFGAAEACAPIGSLLAALVLARQTTEAHLAWVKAGTLFLGIAFLLIFLGRSYPFALFAMALMGAALSIINIHSVSFYSKSVEEAYLGRFFNLMETISFGTFPLAYLLAGTLIQHFDLYLLFLANGLVLAALGALSCAMLRTEGPALPTE